VVLQFSYPYCPMVKERLAVPPLSTWSQDALRLVRINGIGISFDNTCYETYDNGYQLVVKGEEGTTLALCIVEVYDDTQE
ncbi:MAG: hypothetical protein ACLUHA_12280, partial [Bacteroides stercoris]